MARLRSLWVWPSAVAIAMGACASPYAADEAPTGDDAAVAPDVSAPHDAGDADADALSLAAVAPNCPPSHAPSCAPSACAQRTLHATSGQAYPFTITTDATHVYWIEQVAADAGGASDPYNGHGLARVLRTAKRPASAPIGAADELASGQRFAQALALDGAYVYFTHELSATTQVLRLRRDCTPPCAAPEEVVTLPNLSIRTLLRSAPGVIYAQAFDGVTFRITAATKTLEKVLEVGNFASITATNDAVYLTSASSPLQRIATNGDVTDLRDVDASASVGYYGLTNDCSTLWARAGKGPTGLVPLSFMGQASAAAYTFPTEAVFDVKADARFLWVAVANAGGVYAYETPTATLSLVRKGNVFALAVDDDGVYWGDHDGTGTLRMLVK